MRPEIASQLMEIARWGLEPKPVPTVGTVGTLEPSQKVPTSAAEKSKQFQRRSNSSNSSNTKTLVWKKLIPALEPALERACSEPGQPERATVSRFSDLYATEGDYARRLVHYAGQDGLGLTVKDGRLVIGIGGKSDADLLGELRAHEGAVIAILREGLETGADSINPPQPAEDVCPTIVREPPFGLDTVPERYKAAWQAFTAQCPPSVDPWAWQAAICDAGTLFGDFGALIARYGWRPCDLFEPPGGIVWFIRGSPVVAIGPGMARCRDGRIWRRAPR